MKNAQKSLKSKNDGQLEPFTFGKNDSNKLTQLSNTNKELRSDENNLNINTSKDVFYKSQRENELSNNSKKNKMKEDNEQIEQKYNEEDNIKINDDMIEKYNYAQQEDDFYYFISENIPPQNFSEKLRNIKIKCEKLKSEIDKLKRENKKYNPNYVMKKNSHWDD